MFRSSNKSPSSSHYRNPTVSTNSNSSTWNSPTKGRQDKRQSSNLHPSKEGIRTFKITNVEDADAVATVITQSLSVRNLHPFTNKKVPRLMNESLFTLRVAHFEVGGVVSNATVNVNQNWNANANGNLMMKNSSKSTTTATTRTTSTTTMFQWKKAHSHIYYICITRSTNQLLLLRKQGYKESNVLVAYGHNQDYQEFHIGDEDYSDTRRITMNKDDNFSTTSTEEDDEYEDVEKNDDYSLLYNPEDPNHHTLHSSEMETDALPNTIQPHSHSHVVSATATATAVKFTDADPTLQTPDRFQNSKKEDFQNTKETNHAAVLDEISSFPQLVCFKMDPDGTHPYITHVLDLEKLVSIDHPMKHPGRVQLIFQNGATVDIDLVGGGNIEDERPDPILKNNAVLGTPSTGTLKTSKFLWSLLQIHAILCSSAVERNLILNSTTTAGSTLGESTLGTQRYLHALPPLTMKNVDRSELQYLSTVHGFLSENPSLRALLERQRHIVSNLKKVSTTTAAGDLRSKSRGFHYNEEKSRSVDDMDGIAYDIIMGNFSNMTIFFSDDEKKDAEDVLNSIIRQTRNYSEDKNDVSEGKLDLDDVDTSEKLTELLRNKMRMLEAETCRRLIAWEDQKMNSTNPTSPSKRDTTESLGLANLFETLDSLERELENMEEWLLDKAEAIRPLMNDCREVAEENRQNEQRKYSYELLSIELERLLDGLEIDTETEAVLLNPDSRVVYFPDGSIDLGKSEDGVEDIHRAGKALKQAFDKVHQDGGIHLRAVSERVEGLLQVSNSFCDAVAAIVKSVMKATLMASSNHDAVSDSNRPSHQTVAKSLRNIQKEYQTSLLTYIKLIEVLALLKPTILDSIREKYSELVADSIFSKKRMDTYFKSLPGNGIDVGPNIVDLSMYPPVPLKSKPQIESNHPLMKPVQSQCIQIALAEMLPLIAREAYFTAALFALSAKHLSGREKKRNFESAKKTVDFSTRHFRHIVSRLCGIASDVDPDRRNVTSDPMLSLISSILLNEAMDGYIDRQRKGGDHSLSLAYVRATILELRKKVDKQWVSWIEDQIKWVRSNPGVPINGKRAGILNSFARFPSYLDHVMICCKAGRPSDFTVNLSNIKVAAYYLQKLSAALFSSLHECSERETTDKQYAANVMRMENSYFFTQTIKQRDPELCTLFQKQITAASSICKQSTDSYLGFMIKREFKALHSLFSNISRVKREVGDSNVSIHIPFSTFEKSLAKECNRDILKDKIASIYLRMEKHLSEDGGLLPVAWKALVKVLFEWFGRWEKLCSQIYSYKLQPSSSDVVRLAKQVAGTDTKKIKDERQGDIPFSRRDNF